MPGTGAPSFTFVHAADLHLDTPFKGVHEIAPFVAHALREASLDAFDAIIDLTLERKAQFLLLGGDIYDGAERGLRAQLRFREGLARLSAAGVQSFVVHGNHDPVTTGWSAIGNAWPEGVTVFSSNDVEVVPVAVGGEIIATVQGISYATAEMTENLALRLSRPTGPGVHIGLLHCNVAGVDAGYANYSPCTLEDLRRTELDYLALGHIHQRRILARGTGAGDPYVVYPGNTQARSPRATEREPKGAVVVHVRDGIVDELEFVACDQVRFAEISCPIESDRDLAELEDHLAALGQSELDAADGRSVILRARLRGASVLHSDLARPGVLEDLLTHLRELFGQSEPFCWWDELYDETATIVSLDLLRNRGDFTSDLLDLADELSADGHLAEEVISALVGEAPRPLLRHFGAHSDPERLAHLVHRATVLAIDELGAENG